MTQSQRGQIVLVVQSDAISGAFVSNELEGQGFRISGPYDTCSAALYATTLDHPNIAVLDSNLPHDATWRDLLAALSQRGVLFLDYSDETLCKHRPDHLRHVTRVDHSSPPHDLALAVIMLSHGHEGLPQAA